MLTKDKLLEALKELFDVTEAHREAIAQDKPTTEEGFLDPRKVDPDVYEGHQALDHVASVLSRVIAHLNGMFD